MKKNTALAIITARGGSKRIPKKNIKLFAGKPIIHYSIKAALQSGIFEEVMVSTDDNEIADIAIKAGANVPFFRSAKTSDDYATTSDVLREVIQEYQKLKKRYKFCCCLYPTAPFITAERLKESFAHLKSSNTDSLIPIVRFSYPIQRAFCVSDNRLQYLWPENINKRSQDLEPAFHDIGQFYWFQADSLLINKQIYTNNTSYIEIPESEVQDIDTEEDWIIAEMKYKMKI